MCADIRHVFLYMFSIGKHVLLSEDPDGLEVTRLMLRDVDAFSLPYRSP